MLGSTVWMGNPAVVINVSVTVMKGNYVMKIIIRSEFSNTNLLEGYAKMFIPDAIKSRELRTPVSSG